MSQNKLRWQWGETQPILVPAAASTVIHQGDLLWKNSSGKAEPASTFAYDTSLAKTQKEFAKVFLGVAMQESPSGTALAIRVATLGTFVFDDSTETPSNETIGCYMGAVANSDNTYLESTKLISVANSYLAIARVANLESNPAGTALVSISSTVMHGGVPGSDPLHTVPSNS